eukprot:Gb_24889 [translate_table: standard]
MEKDVDKVGKVVRNIKQKLESLDAYNVTNHKKSGCEKGTSVDRSQMEMISLANGRSACLIFRLGKMIQDEYREVVEQRFFYTVTGIKDDEETIECLIETRDSEQFQKVIEE